MQLALKILGYPSYHFFSLMQNLPDADMWSEAFDAKYFHKPNAPVLDRSFWDKLLGHVSATTDMPCMCFFEELLAAYPDAKCILVEREVEAWYKSWHDVQIKNYGDWFFWAVGLIDPKFIGRVWNVSGTCVQGGYFGAKNVRELEEKSRDAYMAHNQRVKDKVPKDKLLLYKLGSGWEPLCEFLGKPIPDVPFPRVNETEVVNEYVQVVIKMGLVSTLKRWALYASPVAVAAFGAWWYR